MQDPSALECIDDMRNSGHLDTPGQMMFSMERIVTESSCTTVLTGCGSANIRNGELPSILVRSICATVVAATNLLCVRATRGAYRRWTRSLHHDHAPIWPARVNQAPY